MKMFAQKFASNAPNVVPRSALYLCPLALATSATRHVNPSPPCSEYSSCQIVLSPIRLAVLVRRGERTFPRLVSWNALLALIRGSGRCRLVFLPTEWKSEPGERGDHGHGDDRFDVPSSGGGGEDRGDGGLAQVAVLTALRIAGMRTGQR